jgi:hypothetical protein
MRIYDVSFYMYTLYCVIFELDMSESENAVKKLLPLLTHSYPTQYKSNLTQYNVYIQNDTLYIVMA